MPYPVLPPPPPPVVTSVVSEQAELAPVIPQDASTIGQAGQGNTSLDSAQRDRPPGSASSLETLPESAVTETIDSEPAAFPSIFFPTTHLPASTPPFLTTDSSVEGLPCLAPPELSAPESSALLSETNTSLVCSFTQRATLSSPPRRPDADSSNPESTSSGDPSEANATPVLASIMPSDTDVSLSTNATDSRLMSRVIVPTPVNRELQRQGIEQPEEIRYIVDTFSPDQLSLPSLQELEEQRSGSSREITTLSLDSESFSASLTNTIPPSLDSSDEFSSPDYGELELSQENSSGSNNPLIRPPSEPIPIFVPDLDQPLPVVPPLLDEDGNVAPLDEGPEIDDDLLLEDIPTFDPSPVLDIEPAQTGGEEEDTSEGEVDSDSEGSDSEDNDSEGNAQPPSTTDRETPPSNQAPGSSLQLEGADDVSSDALEVTADRQVYDQEQQSFLAEGNALMTFRGALLQADRLRVNLRNRVVVAQGNAVLTRGDQVIRGDRLEYDLIQEQGSAFNAGGEVFVPQTTSDFSPTEQSDILNTEPEIPLSERLANEQPVVTAISTGGLIIGGSNSGGTPTGGTVSRIRFEAEEIVFTPDGWEATNVRLTNDPFSPPELEVRSRLVTFRRLDENRSELRARNPRVVLDQGLQIPLLRERAIFDRRNRNPAPFNIGFDEDDRGGFFIERAFPLIATGAVEFTLTPQFFAQSAWENSDGMDEIPPDLDDSSSLLDPDLYGLLGDLTVNFDTKTSFTGSMELTSFDLDDIANADTPGDDLRGSVRLQRKIITGLGPHELTTEYSYRDRLFNGTLGFQTIQKSYGLVLTSPVIPLGDSGVNLTYQGGVQRVNAVIALERRDIPFNTGPGLLDDLITVDRFGRATLTRYQVAARLTRFTFLWRGQPLPATPDQGLRYTPRPVVPFVAVVPSVEGIASFYSNGDAQPLLRGRLSLLGQFGHFSRPYLDFFGFNLSYKRSTEGEESPFLFDRENDREVISGGVTVQLFGPIRLGFQTSLSLSADEEFDTTFILEYSRRTHGIAIRYNPDREQGSINFRISDFDWTGTPEPFGGNPDD